MSTMSLGLSVAPDEGAGAPPSNVGLQLNGRHDSAVSRSFPARRGLLRVLVVDDDRGAADTLSALVESWGHEARAVYEGATAIEAMVAFKANVLLLAVAMPEVDGCQVIRELRRNMRFENTLLIAITEYADEAHRLLGERAGFDHYLVKPVDPSVVEELLLLEYRQLRRTPQRPDTALREPMNNLSLSPLSFTATLGGQS